MKKTLIIIAHPNYGNSLANKTIIDKVTKDNPNAEVRNIADLYPDYQIDVEAEQKALLEADIIVFQYPFYWYNMPAILKLWFDAVFEYQFAYGSQGDKLKDKYFIPSFTVSGQEESYSASGYNRFGISEFTKNIEQTANLAQMKYIDPIYEHGMIYIEGVYNTKESVVSNAEKHAVRLLECISNLN